MIGLVLSVACVATAWLVQRHQPSHRPIVAGLAAQAIAAALCLPIVNAPPRLAMAACALLPVVSTLVYLKAWRLPTDGSSCGCFAALVGGFVSLAPAPLLWWPWILPALYAITVVVGGVAWWVFIRDHGPSGIAQRAASVLLMGDALMLVTMFEPVFAPWQACLVAVALLWVQWRWLKAYGVLHGARSPSALLAFVFIKRRSA